MEILRFDSVSFAYPDMDRQVLKQVSFSMEEGEYLVVCGESGCGKTTLLRQAKPQLKPTGQQSGQIFYRGQRLEQLPEEISAMKIGFVQQNPDNQIVTDKVWRELAFGLENMALPTQAIRRRVGEMAGFFGMEKWFHKNTNELSGGQKQMLNLASVMVMNPELLILDEPTSMLDPLAASNLLQMIQKINRELGVAILICEHRLEDVFLQADQVLLLKEGEVLAKEKPADLARALQENPQASRIYFGLPGAVRIFGELQKKEIYPVGRELPLSVRDARRALQEILADQQKAAFHTQSHERRQEKRWFGKKDKRQPVAIEGKELWYRYSEKSPDILRGLGITLQKGEMLALLGGNGAGKSTLLKLLSGIAKPLRGKITVAKGARIAMLPQNPQALFIYDTLLEDFLDCAESQEEALDMAEQLELTNQLKKHPYDLSGGELQRAAIGKLLLQHADILLLDEPTKGMDAYLKRELAVFLKKLSKEGIAQLIVTHDLDFAAAYADRCAMLFDGQVISEEEPHDFFAGNRIYTTTAGLIAGEMLEGVITCEEVIEACMEEKKD